MPCPKETQDTNACTYALIISPETSTFLCFKFDSLAFSLLVSGENKVWGKYVVRDKAHIQKRLLDFTKWLP